MNEDQILNLLLIILSLDFIMERVLSMLNRKSAKNPIPAELKDIYDEEKYHKSQAYQAEVSMFAIFSASFSFVVTIFALYHGWFGILDQWIRTFSPFSMATPLIFFGILFIVSDIVGTPFSLYRIFVIEEKFGFNKMTLKTYFGDKVKNYLLTFILGGSLLVVFIFLMESIGQNFWIYFWAVMIAFVLFSNLFYTSLILPLFNKLTPLENGELKESIENYCRKVNFPLANIFIMDGSRRSNKGNAFFSGLGKKKKVVLFDTLIAKHGIDELTAVFAHEVGHYKKKHIITRTIFSILIMGFGLATKKWTNS